MANMSYCRFENTFRDLQDCQEALSNLTAAKLRELHDESPDEAHYAHRLVDLCATIAEDNAVLFDVS